MPKGQKIHSITRQQDEIIRKCWEHNSYGHHAAKRAGQLTGLTPSVAHRRAVELGLVFTRERYRWTEPELQVVEENAHLALETIQKRLCLVSPSGVKRTRAAIAGQINSQRFRTNLDGMSHGPLADALGISSDRLRRYRDEKMILGHRLESLRAACGYVEEVADENRHWFYHNDNIVRLLFSCHGQLDLKKVNQLWLMGLLEPYITLFQATPKDLRLEERERTKLAQRRGRKQSKKATQFTISSAPQSLEDLRVDAIRSGRKLLVHRKSRSTGGIGYPPGRTPTGPTSSPSGYGNESAKIAHDTATLHSDSPSSGLAGGPSVGWPIADRTERCVDGRHAAIGSVHPKTPLTT